MIKDNTKWTFSIFVDFGILLHLLRDSYSENYRTYSLVNLLIF
jgi:hypothetical protein